MPDYHYNKYNIEAVHWPHLYDKTQVCSSKSNSQMKTLPPGGLIRNWDCTITHYPHWIDVNHSNTLYSYVNARCKSLHGGGGVCRKPWLQFMAHIFSLPLMAESAEQYLATHQLNVMAHDFVYAVCRLVTP